jgi:hypothetical protein
VARLITSNEIVDALGELLAAGDAAYRLACRSPLLRTVRSGMVVAAAPRRLGTDPGRLVSGAPRDRDWRMRSGVRGSVTFCEMSQLATGRLARLREGAVGGPVPPPANLVNPSPGNSSSAQGKDGFAEVLRQCGVGLDVPRHLLRRQFQVDR